MMVAADLDVNRRNDRRAAGRHDAKLVGARLAMRGLSMRSLSMKDREQKKAGPKRARLKVLAT
jgi:lambda repressor-like predicted transcriptional regulator